MGHSGAILAGSRGPAKQGRQLCLGALYRRVTATHTLIQMILRTIQFPKEIGCEADPRRLPSAKYGAHWTLSRRWILLCRSGTKPEDKETTRSTALMALLKCGWWIITCQRKIGSRSCS